jgi:DNA-binding beta-propeller fold protein YncE
MRAPAVLLALLAAAPAAPAPTVRTALVAGEGLNEPFGVAFDEAGNIYVVEMGGNRVSVRARDGRLSVLAGTGEKGFAGDGGPALQARMNGPKHVSVDGEGAVLIADTENHVIRRYTPRDGMIRRVAGTGDKGAAGLGGPPEECQLNRPHGAVQHPATGDIYVSDSENHRVIRIERR